MAVTSRKGKTAAAEAAAPVTDFFGNAAVAPVVQAAKKGKKEKDTVEMGESYDALQTINWVIKALSAAAKTIETEVKGTMLDRFLEIGAKIKKRPESFKGVGVVETEDGEKVSGGTCMLNKRSIRSVLTAEEQAILTQHGISFDDNVEVPPVEEHFRFNPEYLGDRELMQKLNVALSGVKGLPADLIQKVPAQAGVITQVTNDLTLDQIFELKTDEGTKAMLVKLAGTLAIRGTSKVKTLNEAFKILADLGVDELLAAQEK